MISELSFEQIRGGIDALVTPSLESERNIYWVFDRRLGVAKTKGGALEIFLTGPKIYPKSPTVKRHLEYARWEIAESGEQLDASRIKFPVEIHYLAVVTLVVIELIRAGINDNKSLQEVFDTVEPIIELALRQGPLDEEHIVGLIGELICLEVMLNSVKGYPELYMSILDMWQGHRLGLRDFVIGSTAIEVKTTQQESSSHKVGGVHQVEPATLAGESRLLLLSIGLAESDHDGQSLSDIVQRILDFLKCIDVLNSSADNFTPLQQRFLSDVVRYGSGNAKGYDHRTMSNWKGFTIRYRTTFTPRLYDLLDEDVRILRRRDLIGTHVCPDNIQYQVNLQPIINGLNPVPNWQRAVNILVREALLN